MCFEKEKRQYLTVSEIAGLPSIPLIALDIQGILEATGGLGVLYLNIFRYEKGKGDFDWPIWDVVLKQTAEVLKGLRGEVFRKDDIISTYRDNKNNILIVLSAPRAERKTGRIRLEDLKEVRNRILPYLKERIEQRLGSYEFQKFGFYMGYSLVDKIPGLSSIKILDRAVDLAYQMTIDEERRDRLAKTGRLKGIIDQRLIHVLFQPILHFETSEILGYEALSRGPEESHFENPDLLFYLAHNADMVVVLEEICRERAILDAIGLKPIEKLFLNTEVELGHQERDKDLELLKRAGLKPENIAIELNEKRAASSIPLFRQAAKHFREEGFLIAVDGIDSSYESIQPIIELQPEFIKIGLPLIRNIDSNPTKQELIKALVKISDDLPSILIAVGVETDGEQKMLQDLGIQYGQGYFFAPPTAKPWK